MGVPVVTQRGQHFVARMGASFMTAAGLPEWVDDDAGYLAVQMAQDRAALRSLKRGLRDRLQNRRSWNVVAHTRALEAALEAMAKA